MKLRKIEVKHLIYVIIFSILLTTFVLVLTVFYAHQKINFAAFSVGCFLIILSFALIFRLIFFRFELRNKKIISLKHKSEIEVLRANEKYRKEFLGDVSHELKTPIFNIQGYVMTLAEGGIDDPKVNRKYLKRTIKNVSRMISIVEDLETIAKLEAGELKLSYTLFDIVLIVEEVFEMLEMKAIQAKISLKMAAQKSKHFVYADKDRIVEVLMNLITNSLRYGNEYGTTLVKISDEANKVKIAVLDDGIGIEEQYLNRIFERFFRVDKSRSKKLGGTGLGLSIVKHIIDAHRTEINVKSKPGEGTVFTFYLNKNSNESGRP